MIKSIKILTLVLISITLFGCGTSEKKSANSQDAFYKKVLDNSTTNKEAGKTDLKGKPNNKLGDWVKEGVVCYGVVVATNKNGKAIYGRPVKAKIIKIESNRIKMETMEDINLGEKGGCSKLKFSSGSTWWETEGEIFKNKKDAVDFLKKKGLLK